MSVPWSHWNSFINRRNFIKELEKKLRIEKPEDWGKVTHAQISGAKGDGLLFRYNRSVIKMLKDCRPEVNWKKEWFTHEKTFPYKFWLQEANQRAFLLNFAKEKGMKSPSDWGKISFREMNKNLGGRLLSLYNGSLASALMKLFPDISWKREWFKVIPKNFWENYSNRKSFLDDISLKYNLKNSKDWKRISVTLLRSRGGKGLLDKYNNSLFFLLSSVYPNTDWSNLLVQNPSNSVTTTGQKIVFKQLQYLRK